MVSERGIKCFFVLSCVVKYSGTIGGSWGLRVGRTLSRWSDGSCEMLTHVKMRHHPCKHMNSLLWVELKGGWCCHDRHYPTASLACGGWTTDSGANARPFWPIIEFLWMTVGMCTEQVAPERNLLCKLDGDVNQPFKMKYLRIWKLWKPKKPINT